MKRYIVSYSHSGKTFTHIDGTDSDNDIISTSETKSPNRLTFSVTPHKPVTLKRVALEIPYRFEKEDKLFLNGYQSWTDSREYDISEKMNGIKFIPDALVTKYAFDGYGDYNFADYSGKKGFLHGFGYAYIRNGDCISIIGSLSEANGFTVIYFDTKRNMITIEKDCDGLEISGEYKAFDLCTSKGTYECVFDTYFSMMKVSPLTTKRLKGYTSWYNHYQNINEKIICDNINAVADSELDADVFQIDDGYQTAVGDWLCVDRTKFPSGMKNTADMIKSKGMLAGIWLAPFSCEKTSEIYRHHKDWLIKNADGEPVKAGSNWSGFYALDIYNADAREYIKNTFDTVLNDWGFDLVKLDFLYSACIMPRKDKTRGEIMCDAMDLLRECVKDKLILGCGVPLLPAFGKVDYCRIGTDISLDWNDKPYMRLTHRERVTTKKSLLNTAFRRHLDKRAFMNDPDVFLLRDDNISLSQEQKELVCMINCIFGGVIFTSDNVSGYTDEKKAFLEKCLSLTGAHIDDASLCRNILSIEFTKDNKQYFLSYDIRNGKIIKSNIQR